MSVQRHRHNAYQRRKFEESVGLFRQAVPDDVQERTACVVTAAGLSPGDRVLDVGTGTGVLIPHIRQHGVRRIVACDLSASMLAEVHRRYPQVQVWCGDVVELPVQFGSFDVVFFNAMFGNLWDQRLALERVGERMSVGGRIVISHPMGARFVEELRREDPTLVPHPLPGAARVDELIRELPLQRQSFRDDSDLYLCVLGRVA